MSKLRALDLFKEGEKGVYKRMAEVIKRGLHKKTSELKKGKLKNKDNGKVIKIIAGKLHVDVNRLNRIYQGKPINGDVNYDLFDRLEFPLDLSIHRVLGKPEKLNMPKIKKEWDEECIKHPMLRAAAVIRSGRRCKHEVTQKDEVELYVTLRAIRELHLNHQ